MLTAIARGKRRRLLDADGNLLEDGITTTFVAPFRYLPGEIAASIVTVLVSRRVENVLKVLLWPSWKAEDGRGAEPDAVFVLPGERCILLEAKRWASVGEDQLDKYLSAARRNGFSVDAVLCVGTIGVVPASVRGVPVHGTSWSSLVVATLEELEGRDELTELAEDLEEAARRLGYLLPPFECWELGDAVLADLFGWAAVAPTDLPLWNLGEFAATALDGWLRRSTQPLWELPHWGPIHLKWLEAE